MLFYSRARTGGEGAKKSIKFGNLIPFKKISNNGKSCRKADNGGREREERRRRNEKFQVKRKSEEQTKEILASDCWGESPLRQLSLINIKQFH